MNAFAGEFIASLLGALVLSWVAALVTSRRYRSAMRRLMSVASPPSPAAGPAVAPPALPPPADVTLADNRRAGAWLTVVMIGISCLIAVTSTWLWMRLAVPDLTRTPMRVFAMAVYYLWPVVVAVGLIWRWSRIRLLTGFVLWMAAVFVFLLWRSVEPRPLQLLTAFATDVIPSFLVVTLVFFSGATRAIAPWLFLPFVGLVASSLAGMRLLSSGAQDQAPWVAMLLRPLEALPSGLGLIITLMAFALLPWALAWWPLRQFGRALGRAYARKHLSELLVVFTAVWAIALLELVASRIATLGGAAALVMAPLLWVPIVFVPYLIYGCGRRSLCTNIGDIASPSR